MVDVVWVLLGMRNWFGVGGGYVGQNEMVRS